MDASQMLNPMQLESVYKISNQYGVDPKLILAIGWHETQWGRLGDGKSGMYTGYGSYDSGSDYSLAGFESQVTGTAKKMKAWGMSPGSVTLESLRTGNSGVLPTGIYATDQNWPNAVFNIYKNLTGTSGSSSPSKIPSGLPDSTISAWKPSILEQIKGKAQDTWYWLKGTDRATVKFPSAADQLEARESFNQKYGLDLPTEALQAEVNYQNSLRLGNKFFTAGTLTVIFLIVVIVAFFAFFKAFDVEAPTPSLAKAL